MRAEPSWYKTLRRAWYRRVMTLFNSGLGPSGILRSLSHSLRESDCVGERLKKTTKIWTGFSRLRTGDQWWTLVVSVMNLCVPCFHRWATVNFSTWIQSVLNINLTVYQLARWQWTEDTSEDNHKGSCWLQDSFYLQRMRSRVWKTGLTKLFT